jgi:hypothetical protein
VKQHFEAYKGASKGGFLHMLVLCLVRCAGYLVIYCHVTIFARVCHRYVCALQASFSASA